MRTWALLLLSALSALSAAACSEQFTSADSQELDPDASDGTGGSGGPRGSGGAASGGRSGAGGATVGNAGASGSGGVGVDASSPVETGGVTGSGGAPATGGVSGAGGDPNTTPPIPTSGLLLWLRADVGVVETNGRVSVWNDQSGSAANATQNAPELRPTFGSSALNGHPAVLFDGVNDYLDLPAGFTDFARGVSILAVVESADDQTCTAIFEASDGPEVEDLHLGRHFGQLHYEVKDTLVLGGDFLPDELRRLALVHRPSTAVEMRQAGVSLVDTFLDPLPTIIERRFSYVGRTLYDSCPTWNGYIGELLVYDHALDDVEYESVEVWLAGRWD